MRVFKQAALVIILAVVATFALARSEGLYNPSSNAVGDYQGIDSNNPASGSPPSLVFVTNNSTVSGGGTTTQTWTAVSLGATTGFGSRRIIAINPFASAAGRVLSSATINGVSADTIISMEQTSNPGQVNVASAIVTAGTSVTVTFTYTAANFSGNNLLIYTIDDALLTTGGANHAPTFSADAQTASGTSIAASLNVSAGSAAIGFGSVGSSSPSFSVNDLSINNDASITNQFMVGHANNVTAFTPAHLTFSWTGTAAGAAGLLAWK